MVPRDWVTAGVIVVPEGQTARASSVTLLVPCLGFIEEVLLAEGAALAGGTGWGVARRWVCSKELWARHIRCRASLSCSGQN